MKNGWKLPVIIGAAIVAYMVMDNIVVKRGQEYRINNPKYSERVKYQWFTARDRK